MAHPSKDRGDRFERDVIAVLARVLGPYGLTVERTRAGYQRDAGDVHVLTPDGQVLATVQCKAWNQREWNLGEWLGNLGAQRAQARARFGLLALKRPRVSDAAHGYAMTDVEAWAVMLAALVECESKNHALRQRLADLREDLAQAQRLARALATAEHERDDYRARLGQALDLDPDVLADPPGTERGAQVYPRVGTVPS
jgi:hypothetical protein